MSEGKYRDQGRESARIVDVVKDWSLLRNVLASAWASFSTDRNTNPGLETMGVELTVPETIQQQNMINSRSFNM